MLPERSEVTYLLYEGSAGHGFNAAQYMAIRMMDEQEMESE